MKRNKRYAALLCAIIFFSCGKKMAETKPVRKDVTETVFASGQLEADNTYNLTAQADGYLQQMNFEEGDVVKAGTIVAVVDNRENNYNQQSAEALYNIARANTISSAPALREAANNISIAKQKLQLDSTQMERYRRLYESNSVAKYDYDNALLQFKNSNEAYQTTVESYRLAQQQAAQSLISGNSQKQLTGVQQSNNQIKVVVGGKVYKKLKRPGDYVRKGDTIAVIGNNEFIYARVSIDESNVGKVRVGQEALIQLNTYKDKTYKATVTEIYPQFDEATQSFFCKLIFSDSLDFRIAGTQLQSNIVIGLQKNALLIPRNFLDFGGRVQIKGAKEPVIVKTGFVSSNWVQVISGITENTVLVTDNISANNMQTSEAGSQMH